VISVVGDEFVKGVEFHHPEEEFPLRVSQHFEVLSFRATSDKKTGKELEALDKILDQLSYLTEREKSPGEDSLALMRNAPSCGCFFRRASASALLRRPMYHLQIHLNKVLKFLGNKRNTSVLRDMTDDGLRVRGHVNVIAGNQTFLAIMFSSVPVLIIVHV
jgi:hypothetical protein